MRTKSLITVAVIVLLGVAAALVVLRTDRGAPGVEDEGGEAEAAAYARGPHNGRLLSDAGLQMEVTIYETGVDPHFRVFPLDTDGKSIAPSTVKLRVELHRLGGRVDQMTFVPEANYLRSEQVVEEPHSFDVKVFADHAGRPHQWSYSQVEGKVQLGDDQLESAGIVINTAGPRDIVTVIELPGEVKADETRLAHVVPTLQGVITQVTKAAGDRVRRGEVMAVLTSRELADAKGQYLAAGQRVEFARVALEREEMLWKKKISAEQEFLAAKRNFDEAELTRNLTGQKLVALGVPAGSLRSLASSPAANLSRFEVRAPLDGTVLERDVTVGEAVTADKQLFTVADLSVVWVDVSVHSKDLGAVRAGQAATIVSKDTAQEATGKISVVGPLVGQETRAAIARIIMPNRQGEWRPGVFVTVTLTRTSAAVPIAVSADAVQTFRDWQVVFVRYGDWFEARPLKLGRTDGTWVEVLNGLTVGDRYAGANSFAVKAEIGKLGASHDH
ncbi:MAG TPA: efflux RND transporter periplasmic adaptor subunit [Vicinamibacterales bacterium]|nr:efflux RND transporter periplasmic adaptor subunit [Vicinamibacterales bacterium]